MIFTPCLTIVASTVPIMVRGEHIGHHVHVCLLTSLHPSFCLYVARSSSFLFFILSFPSGNVILLLTRLNQSILEPATSRSLLGPIQLTASSRVHHPETDFGTLPLGTWPLWVSWLLLSSLSSPLFWAIRFRVVWPWPCPLLPLLRVLPPHVTARATAGSRSIMARRQTTTIIFGIASSRTVHSAMSAIKSCTTRS